MRHARCFWMLVGIAGLCGCTEEYVEPIGVKGHGESCSSISQCEAGLDCENGLCVEMEALPPLEHGKPCSSQGDCTDPLVCGPQNVCSDSLGKSEGQACGLTEDCQPGLVCDGLTGMCKADDGAAGTYDLDEPCEDMLDCRRPFICGLHQQCTKIPLYLGPDCSRSAREAGAFRVYFELPDPAQDEAVEFYRLPFPNDIRRVEGRIDLSGHPSPGEVVGIDVARTYFTVIEEDVDGFATNAPVFFRFSDYVEPASICLSPGSVYPEALDGDDEPLEFCQGGDSANVQLINIDPDSSAYNSVIPVQMAYGRSPGQYICHNWLGIAPLDGVPLDQGTIYAAIVTTGIRDIRNDPPIQDKNFSAIMKGELEAPAMAPLHAWIADQGIDPATIAGATVFTTGTPSAVAPLLRQAVHAQATAAAFHSNAVDCTLASSPCDDGLLRGCGAPVVGFKEIQGTYSNPVLQQGVRPYHLPQDGGHIVYGAGGLPTIQGQEAMCYALAVPLGAAPAEGWPVVIYGHGTGGDYRSALLDGTAEILTAAGFAVIGFDNVSHGPRQGGDPGDWLDDPGRLFFNLLNPRASRDNVLQGAADLFQLVRLLKSDTPSVTGLGAVPLNPDSLYFLGHSQGTVIAPPFLAVETELQGVMLSGAGAELALSVLHKKQPGDVSRLAGVFFGDNNLSRVHPMMGMLALLFGPADAVNFARSWVVELPVGRVPAPLLHIMGVGDGFTPDITQNALVRAMKIPLVQPLATEVDGVSTVAAPASGNVGGVTAGAVQLVPNDYDGHFVLFGHPEGEWLLDTFFSSIEAGAATIERAP